MEVQPNMAKKVKRNNKKEMTQLRKNKRQKKSDERIQIVRRKKEINQLIFCKFS